MSDEKSPQANQGAAKGAAKADSKKAPATPKNSSAPDNAAPANSMPLAAIVVAALMGAAIALAVQVGLTMGGVWPASSVAPAANLGGLERRVTALESSDPTEISRDEIEGLRRSLTRLREDVSALEARPAAGAGAVESPAMTRRVDDLADRIENLDGRLPSDLDARLAAFADEAQVGAVEARVAQLETDIQYTDVRLAATGLALAQLSRAAQGSSPFTAELAAAEIVLAGDPRLDQIAPFAATGVPTLAMLRADFPPLARQVARAAMTPQSVGAWDRVWAWLGKAISFRRTGEADGPGAGAILARAEARLAEGNLAAAAAEMNGLEEAPRALAADWIAAAEARVAIDRLVGALSSDVIEQLQQ